MNSASQKLLCFFLFVIVAVSIFPSCKKDLTPASIAVASKDGIPAFPLTWDGGSDYMPTPAGTPTILLPWANGSSKGFSSDIWYDYKMSDGWVLVYNTFNTSSLPANPWFVLYNRYRGLLRIYVYITTNGFQPSSYLTSGLNLSPNAVNSSLLNYIAQDIVDPSVNQSAATKIEPTQIAMGTWYASEYEMAYDPNVASSTYQQLGMNWTLKWTNVTSINMGGSIQGSINGTITTPASSFNIAGAAKQGLLYLTGLTVLNANKGTGTNGGDGNHLGLPSLVFSSISSGLNSGLQGVIKNIASGIFGGSSANTQQVSLSVNATLTLNGSSTSSGAIFPDPGLGIGIPGVSNSQSASGYIPKFNDPMGIFNLTGKPTINRHTTRSTGPTIGGIPYNQFQMDYTVNTSIFNSLFVFNSKVINTSSTGAALKNQQTSVVVLNPNTDPSYYFQGYGTLETIGSYTAYTGNPVTITYDAEHSSYPQNNLVAIRVTADVVPNNGAPKSTITHMFFANLVDN